MFKPNLIKKKSSIILILLDNTIDISLRLDIKFEEEDIRKIFIFNKIFISKLR